MISITVNGNSKTVKNEISLAELLEELDLSDKRIAVELNKKVIRRKDLAKERVCDRDKIEIVHFVGGG